MNKTLISLSTLLLYLSWLLATDITVTMYDENQYASGYTIFGTLEGKYSAIIDKNGNEIWNSGNQDLVYYNFSPEGDFFGCQFLDDNLYVNYLNSVEFSLTDEIVWREPNNEFAHHEILKLPWGNYLGIVSKDIIAPIPEGDWGFLPLFNSEYSQGFPWRYDKVVEWDKDTKEIVWSWVTIDHYSMEDYDSTLWNLTTFTEGIIEWTHINALYFNELDSSIYISSRHLSRITKIDYPSGDIIWNMGREMPSGEVDFGHDLGFSWQHSLDINNGNIVFLDNGERSIDYRNTEYRITRAMEISIDETKAVPIAEIIWEYDLPANLFSMASGNVQKLQNGNYLITTIGNNGTSLELTPDYEIVWEANYGTPLIYRASRISDTLLCSQIDCSALNINNRLISNSFTLNQVYPNPFNPKINIRYNLSKCSFLTAEILNLKGQSIEILYSDYQLPGTYSIEWNAATQSSGMYIIRMSNQSTFVSHKILLLK